MILWCSPEKQSCEINDHTSSLIIGTNSEMVCEYKSSVWGFYLSVYLLLCLLRLEYFQSKAFERQRTAKELKLKSQCTENLHLSEIFCLGKREMSNVPW